MSPVFRRAPSAPPSAPSVLLVALALGACGGSGSDGDGGPADAEVGDEPGAPGIGQLPTPDAPADTTEVDGAQQALPDRIAAGTQDALLRLVVDGACGAAGEEIAASLYLDAVAVADEEDGGGDDGEGGAGLGTNVTAYADFAQGLGNTIDVVSRTDDAIRFRITRPDVVALTATVEDRTLTRYFGAWPADAPAVSALRKAAPAGCLWSLRLPPDGGGASFCGTVYSRGGEGLLGQGERRLDIAGCETENAAGLPVIGLPAVGDGP